MTKAYCSTCAGADRDNTVLVPAARFPALKGSHFVGSRGVRNLFVCRQCGTIWQTWHDQREGQQCWRAYPHTLVPVFAADASLVRLVEWLASHYVSESFGLLDAHAKNLIRRRPGGLQEGTSALFRSIGEFVPPRDGATAARLSMLFHLLGLVVERSIRGDLRPHGPRAKPPTRYRPRDVEAAGRSFQPREVDGITRCARTHDVVRRLMWEDRWGHGAGSPDRAVIVIDDISTVDYFLENLPLEVVDDGILRGVYAKTIVGSLQKLHNLGRLPENDHAIWMPSDAWLTLQKLLDPLERLAASYRRICTAASRRPNDLLQRFQMESILANEPIRKGARFTEFARKRLEKISRQLSPGGGDKQSQARDALEKILVLEKTAAETDARCTLTPT